MVNGRRILIPFRMDDREIFVELIVNRKKS